MSDAQNTAIASIRTTGESILAKIKAARAQVAENPHLAGQFYLVSDTGGGLVVNEDRAGGYRFGGMFSETVMAFPSSAKGAAHLLAGHWNRRLTPAQRVARCTVTVMTREEAWTALETSWRETFALFDTPKA